MANVVLPILNYFALGATINMMNYNGNYRERNTMFSENDFVLHQHPAVLNASYYILEDGRLPYSAMRLPIDLVFGRQQDHQLAPQYTSYNIPRFVDNDKPIHDVAALVMIMEFNTGKHTIKPNAVPLPGWQDSTTKTLTHYAEEVTFGRKCFVKLDVASSAGGDVQIIKRILVDAMDTSGHFTNKDISAFADLWKSTFKTAKKNPDVRGQVFIHNFYVTCPGIEIPFKVQRKFNRFLSYLPNISIPLPECCPLNEQYLLSVSFKPLHNLDDQFPPMEVNKQTEEYLTSLHVKLQDLQKVLMDGYVDPDSEEHKKMKEKLWRKINNLRKKLRELIPKEPSIYKDIEVEKFDEIFQQYELGLDHGDKNYITTWEKLLEKIEKSCSDKFRKPTPGVLNATEDEVANIRSSRKSLKSCKRLCRKEERCRAIGYDENNPKMCRIYSVSTNTAAILYPEDSSMKIYDRYCVTEREDDDYDK